MLINHLLLPLGHITNNYQAWFDWILFSNSGVWNSQPGPTYVDTTFASSFKWGPLRNSIIEEIKRYVNIIHNFILLPSIVLSFIHNCLSPFKGCKKAERPPTKWPHKSNCRGIGGISPCGGHTWKRRVLLPT